ncbi:MAG TPA: hypothetical protein VGK30_01240 [Candidatus Binatia bacterium]|jgi:hypothetical protein
MALSVHHKRFLILEQGIGSMFINFPLTAAITWLSVRSLATVPLWGMTSIAGSTLGTAFILPLLTSIIVSRVVGHHVRGGRVTALMPPPELAIRWAERTSARRGAMLGCVSMVFAAVPVILVFALAGPAEMARTPFIWFQGAFAAALGAVVTPLVAWWALADPRTTGYAIR